MPPRSRTLSVVTLEDRLTPNSRFVVPFDLPADGVSTFYTLRAALSTPRLAAGDVVQVEPRSVPGNISNADLPNVASLTVRGNPEVGAAETPTVYANDRLTVSAARGGFAVRDLSLVLLNGPLEFRAAGTVSTSHLTGQSGVGNAVVEVTDASGVLLDRNTIVAGGPTPEVVRVDAAPGAANRIVGNQLVAAGATGQTVLRYAERTAPAGSAVADVVEGNTLLALTPGTNPLLGVDRGVSGVTITGNTFRDLARSDRFAVKFGGPGGAPPPDGGVTFNLTENLFANVSHGVHVTGLEGTNPGGTKARFDFERNVFDTRPAGTATARPAWGVGVRVETAGTTKMSLKLEGNDFRSTRIGVLLTGLSPALDLGGGPFGSRGGNDFRGFTDKATFEVAALINSGGFSSTNLTGTAQFNSFSPGIDPELVVLDGQDITTAGNVLVNQPLSATQAYVQSLYTRLLRRLGDVRNPADAGGWVGQLDTGRPAVEVVTAIYRSVEGIGVQVSDLFERYLERKAEPQARADFARFVQGGMTFETVAAVLVDSGEYRTRVGGSDPRWVQTLFVKALGRSPNDAETQAWVGAVRGNGGNRLVVARLFVDQQEARTTAVSGFYTRLLKRAVRPTAAEVSGWADLPGRPSLYDIYVGFLSTGEYRANG